MRKTCWILTMALWTLGCGDKDDTAAGCSASCDGTVLTECVDGEAVQTDCADEDMICHEMGADSHCMPEGAMDR